jgi:uncharacterized protein YqeY
MELKTRINEDLKAAIKSKDATRRDAIRNLQAAIKQREVDSRKTLEDAEIVEILMTEAKKRRESIEHFEQAGRTDSAESERFELRLIEGYLPQQMSRDEIRAEAQTAIAEVGAVSPKDMGRVMGMLMPRVKGRADGRLVNEIVRELLG